VKLKEVLVHLGNVIVAGATFTITVDAPVVSVGVPSHTLTVSSSGDLLGQSSKASLKSDMESQTPVPGIPYTNGAYVGGILQWDGDLNGSQESTKLDKNDTGVVVDDTTSGPTTFTIVTPAQNTVPSPDPAFPGTYPGTWTLISAGQTKLVTVE